MNPAGSTNSKLKGKKPFPSHLVLCTSLPEIMKTNHNSKVQNVPNLFLSLSYLLFLLRFLKEQHCFQKMFYVVSLLFV